MKLKEFPTVQPSKTPFVTNQPSYRPTHTIRPTSHPHLQQNSPSCPPSFPPSESGTAKVVIITTTGQYISSSAQEILEIKGSGVIEITGGAGGNTYVLYPPTPPANETILIISDFNQQSDSFDLQYLPGIYSVKDISYFNPFTMYLTENVKVICSSLRSVKPNQIHFTFALKDSSTVSPPSLFSPSVLVALVLLVICFVFLGFGWLEQSSDEQVVASTEFVDQNKDQQEDYNKKDPNDNDDVTSERVEELVPSNAILSSQESINSSENSGSLSEESSENMDSFSSSFMME